MHADLLDNPDARTNLNKLGNTARRLTLGGVLIAALAAAGCGGATAYVTAPKVASVTVTNVIKPTHTSARFTTHSATARPAPIVHLPPHWSAGRRVPLVIALHASGGDPAGFETTSGWDAVADEHGFVVAYLGSAAPAWKYVSNVAYISAEIHSLTARYNIDPHRVYVTGFSAGAYISYFVGCRLSGTVAAIAPVSGVMVSQHCNPAHPVSELTIIGTHDIIPLAGTPRFPAPAKVTALWRRLDRCPATRPKTTVTGPTSEQTWSSCAAGSAVGFYVINGGVHVYPGAPGLPASDPSASYDASEAVWSFFAAHRSGG